MEILADVKRKIVRIVFVALIPCLTLVSVQAQQRRISAQIDNSQTVVIAGHVHPQAQARYDRGTVENTFQLPSITLHFKPSAAQEQSLTQLLSNQQNPSSPQYHQWLTPEQYADQFGIASSDMDQIAAWLKSQGFVVQLTARSRTWITFSATAQQVQNGLHTSIHHYSVNSETHYANATDPQLPAAFAGMVSSIRGLNDFRLKPKYLRKAKPEFNTGGMHAVVPDDWANIYNVGPLFTADINGSGQSLVIAGQTEIILSDITKFRSMFNLPAINLQQVPVPGQQNPGVQINSGDLGESDLDIEWSGAVARAATIIFVYSPDAFTSLFYAIDQNLAPVVSVSYGFCEYSDLVDLPTFQNMAQQANAQGITWMAPAGDSGATDCEDVGVDIAQDGLAVGAPASIPEVTSVGGTEFNEQGGTYWSNTALPNDASALGYIPEMVWNDTAAEQELSAGGGGASQVFFKPVWQTGTGVPSDGMRDVPDVAFNAAVEHDATFVYSDGEVGYFGGTSLGAPTMAGIVTLLNQYLVSTGAQKQPGVANINPTLYRLGQSSSGIFHDVTTGNNMEPCVVGSPNCSGGIEGYNAAPNYDQASGWGSLNVYNFVHQWTSIAPTNSAVVVSVNQNSDTAVSGSPDAVFEYPTNSWSFTLILSEEAGVSTTLTGITINGANYSSQIGSLFGTASISAHGSIQAQFTLSNLAVPVNVPFTITGTDMSGHVWSEQVSIPFQPLQTQLAIGGVSNALSGQAVFAPGEIISIYGTGFGDFTQYGLALPLTSYLAGFYAYVGNNPAYLYYVSPVQVNLQIPWETPSGTAATLTIANPYSETTYTLPQISQAAPALCQFSPGVVAAQDASYNAIGTANPARPGQTIVIYASGLGRVTNTPLDGEPAVGVPLSRTIVTPTVIIGGQIANVMFSGLTPGSVSLYQLNVVVPLTVPAGNQQVQVALDGQSSPPSAILIQ